MRQNSKIGHLPVTCWLELQRRQGIHRCLLGPAVAWFSATAPWRGTGVGSSSCSPGASSSRSASAAVSWRGTGAGSSTSWRGASLPLSRNALEAGGLAASFLGPPCSRRSANRRWFPPIGWDRQSAASVWPGGSILPGIPTGYGEEPDAGGLS